MGETTKLANLVNPQVLADYIDKKLIDAIRNEAIKPARRLPIGYRMEYENP